MTTIAKGCFPGRPRKKIFKLTTKYKKKSTKINPVDDNLKLKSSNGDACSDFHSMFRDDNEQEAEFLGFSSEECGLQAYKRVSKQPTCNITISNDILGSRQLLADKDKVTTRRSYALDTSSNSDNNYSANLTISKSPLKQEVLISKNCQGISDNAFMKYQNSKLDFHRLSKKAKSKKDSYEDITSEERKDTSTASLKYAAQIYQKVKGTGSALIQVKSPIKPATFIPPPTPLGQSANQNTCNTKNRNFGQEILSKKNINQSQIIAKAVLNRTNRGRKAAVDGGSTGTSKHSKGFTLPLKSSRSSRIIKLNRKYSDGAYVLNSNERNSSENIEDSSLKLSSKTNSNRLVNDEDKSSRESKPLLKQATFRIPRKNQVQSTKLHHSSAERSNKTNQRSRRLIKRARFKHPTSSDALVLGSESADMSINRNPIREATFTAPTLRNLARETLDKSSQRDHELSDFGLSSKLWSSLYVVQKRNWEIGADKLEIPPWTKQEIHNILHGAHTFGPSWSSIARQYEFHHLHRDWMSVCKKGKKCCIVGLLSGTYKVNSSILLQLKPKFSANPNMTVYTPTELYVRGLSSNIPCNIVNNRKRKEKSVSNRLKINKDVTVDLSINNRIFGTQLSEEFQLRKVKLREISKEDLYLGLSAASWFKMLKPRSKTKFKKTAWTPWEIHNILHGVHHFGVGAWATICTMYRFMEGRNNLMIRARFKSVCYRGLIVAGDVRDDLIPRLHVVLSEKGKKYFKENKISVNICSLSKKNKTDENPIHLPNFKSKHKIEKKSSEDGVSISPSRRAVHLFGSPPLWDDLTQPELIHAGDDRTPVLEVLESSLRKNVKSQRRSSADDVISSPTSCKSVSPSQSNLSSVKRKRSKSESKGNPVQTSKPKGPRIKHVCRRASLVTGHTLATMGDHHPHLTALPQKEREKIMAHPNKFIDSDSASENEKRPKPIEVVPKKRMRRRSAPRRCGKCETCSKSPCLQCAMCRKYIDSNDPSSLATLPCTSRKPCLHNNDSEPVKRTRKPTVPPPASRKSSRLQQQLVPLVAPLIAEQQTFSLTTVEGPPYFNTTTVTDTMSSPESSFSWSDFFNRSNENRQSLIKIDRWKGIYDLDLLWKSGGHPVIASSPAPPPIVCLLCGSSGHPEEPVDQLIHCSSCCEPFHVYCADPNYDHPVVKKAIEGGSWTCKRCKYCLVCGNTGKMLECRRCTRSYHTECLGSTYPIKRSSNHAWVCMRCITCGSCGAVKPGNLPSSNWSKDYSLCQKCSDLYEKGNYCPICQKCYSDEDYDCRMIQCAKCKRWIHSRCENLTVEMYTILSHMPDSVRYKCPMCDGRACKLKEISNIVDHSSAASAVEFEKLLKSLSKLPPPLWKKLIEKEIQSGLDTIVMSLFHNKMAFSVLKKNEPISEAQCNHQSAVSKPRDLFAIRFAVHNQRYQSIGQFYGDIMHVIGSMTESNEREALEKIFIEEASRCFSWFNFKTGKIKDEQDVTEDVIPHTCVELPYNDHNYPQSEDKPPSPTTTEPFTHSISKLNNYMDGYDDERQCIFCNYYGDDEAVGRGRLLYCGQDEWCHVNCALWSAEVYEQHDGSLKNVHSAASRGKMMKCDYCKLPGATVGCNTRGCPKNYHFSCAKSSVCFFHRDKKVFCRRHANLNKSHASTDQLFTVNRLVCVDNDEMRPNRRWHRGIPALNLSVRIGSLTVQQIGYLTLSSDSKDFLKPISYRITRLFWSTFHANKKTVYNITINENESCAKPKPPPPPTPKEVRNHTIAHSVAESPKSHRTPSKSHRNPPNSTPTLTSPPRVQRTNLMECLNADSQIGPLSPTRRIGAALPVQDRCLSKRGQYTIIANINKTLPQAVTPHPEEGKFATSSSSEVTKTTSSLKLESPIKISSQNPFLNPLMSSSSTSSKDQTSSLCPDVKDSNELLHFQRTTPAKVTTTPRKNLKIKRSVSQTPTPQKIESPVKPPSSLPSDKSLSVASISDSNSTPAEVKTGVSGSIFVPNLQKDKQSVPSSTTTTSTSTETTSTSKSTTVDSMKSSQPSPVFSCSPSSLIKENALKACRVILNRPSPSDMPKCTLSSVISLIRGARSAVDTEKHSLATISSSDVSSSTRRKTRNANESKTNATRDVAYEQPSSQASFWKKTDKDLTTPCIPITRESRRSKNNNINYNEDIYDEALEETMAKSLKDKSEILESKNANNDIVTSSIDDSSCKSNLSNQPCCKSEENKLTSNKFNRKRLKKTLSRCVSMKKKQTSTDPNEESSSRNIMKDDSDTIKDLKNETESQEDHLSSINESSHEEEDVKQTSSDTTHHEMEASSSSGDDLLVTPPPAQKPYNDAENHLESLEPTKKKPVYDVMSHDSVSSISATDDEESVSLPPSRQLRKFALKSSQTSTPTKPRLTRSRSKSFEPRSVPNDSKAPDIKSRSRLLSDDKKQRPIDSSLNSDAKDVRRYPRRNTFTCLKSFSGLSTNYALASYSRDKVFPQSSPEKKEVEEPANKSEQTAIKNEQPTKFEDFKLKNVTRSSSSSNVASPPSKLSTLIETSSDSPLHNESPSDHPSPTISPESIQDEDIISALVSSEDAVRSLLNDVLNTLDYKKPSIEEARIQVDVSSCNNSIEEFRGGGDGSPLPVFNRSDFAPLDQSAESLSNSALEAISSADKTLSNCDVREPTLDSVSLFKNNDCPILSADDVTTVLDNTTDLMLTTTTQNTTSANGAIQPVLNSSQTFDSRSLGSIPTLSPITPHNQLPFFRSPVVTLRSSFNPPVVHTPNIGVPTKCVPVRIPVSTNSVSENTVFETNSNSRMKKLPHSPPSARPSEVSQKLGLIASPVPPPFSPMTHPQLVTPVDCPSSVLVAPPHVLCGPYQAPPSALPSPNIMSVPYSVRVTMTMTPAVQTERLMSPQLQHSTTQSGTYQQSKISKPFVIRHTPTYTVSNQKSQPDRISITSQSCTSHINSETSKDTLMNPSDRDLVSGLKTDSYSGPFSQNQIAPVPLPTSSKSSDDSLETLIEYYSAKNKLTAQEKAVVRTIISQRMNAGQPPKLLTESERNSVNAKKSNEKYSDENLNPIGATTKRHMSRDSTDNRHPLKIKRRRKDKISLKVDPDNNSPSFVSGQSEQPSCLYNLYKKRCSFKKPDKLLNQFLSTFNIFLASVATSKKSNPFSSLKNDSNQHLIYEIKSDDGYYAKGPDLHGLIEDLLSSVQECRENQRSTLLPTSLCAVMTPYAFLGLSHDAVRFLVEQLPGATHCPCYKAKYHKHKKSKEEISHINPHGCCRAEKYKGRSKPDMFSFLASKHRPLPEYQPERSQSDEMMQLSNRRPTSMDSLPMAMRFRHLRTFSKQAVGVYRSSIHGRGLFCKRDIEASEMIMEYTGQIIRRELTDKREQYYESKSIGCYMFRMDDQGVVDATVMGSAARFINHSCEPNCYSKIVHIEGKKHIVIFALKKIYRGEELTYDYKFPIEDESHKIACNCGARVCRKFMN